MKKIVFVLLTALAITFVTGGCSDSSEHNDHTQTQKSDLYYCPMHPEVTSDKPGVCPICHMDLVKKSENSDKDAAQMEGMLSLSKTGQLLANIETIPVKKESITRKITAFGYLDFTESGRKSVTSRFNGRIEKLYVDETGDKVEKGQLLFEIYSPDLIQAQNDYLLSLKNTNINLMNLGADQLENTLIKSSRKKLQIMGLTEAQIKTLEQSNSVQMTIGYYSPYSGTVLEKKIQEGMYVNEGAVIYELADMTQLWNIAEIFSDDLSMIRIGDNIQFITSSYPGEQFSARISFIYPVVNSQSRTIKIRADLRNPGGKLKPQMYTESVIEKAYAGSLVIPENAVLFTGKKNIVWVKNKDNQFEQREVRVGVKSDGKYQILSGLKESELVASSGGYLIDSESQLKGGAAAGHDHPDEIGSMEKTAAKALSFNAVCPVQGNPVSDEVKPVEYNGKLYGFCCPGCDKKFIDNPQKYLNNLSEDGKKFIKI